MKNNNNNHNNKIGQILFKKIFLTYLLILLVFTSYEIYLQYSNAKNNILKDMRTIEVAFHNGLSTSVWHLDQKQINANTEAIKSIQGIIGVSIISPDDEIYSQRGELLNEEREREAFVFQKNTRPKFRNDLIKYTFNIINNELSKDEVLAIANIYTSEEAIYETVKENLIYTLVFAFSSIIILWFLFNYFANKLLTNPLEQIIHATHNLDIEKPKEIKLNHDDKNKTELNILVDTFNSMSLRISDSYNELKNLTELLNRQKENIVKINKEKTDFLENMSEELQQKVHERTLEYEETNEELHATINNLKQTQDKLIESEKMAGLGSIVAGVTHEINTPVGVSLTGVTYFIDITKKIKKDFEDNNLSEDEFKEYLENADEVASIINLNLNRTAQLIRGFKQVAVDQTSEEERSFDIKNYINEILLSIHNVTKKTKHKIKIECEKNIVINSQPGAFSQIITNLIMNSIIHAYDKDDEGTILIKVTKEDNLLKLIYKDDGKGISKENLKKIYNPFFTTNRENGGSGLGLNIIYKIVTKNLKGNISCNSKEGSGVEFIITFPIKE